MLALHQDLDVVIGVDTHKGFVDLLAGFPFHAADLCGRVTAMWLRIRRW